eukprot:6490655-Amphidinium_carterae.3
MATQFAPPCESFHVASADPVNGWGGLQILVHKNRGLEMRWTKQIGDRILCAELLLSGSRWLIACVYAPTSVATDEEFQSFMLHLEEAFALAKAHKVRLLLGGDFNLRVGIEDQEFDQVVGTCTYGKPRPKQRERVFALLTMLKAHATALWTTMIGDAEPTWISAQGALAQKLISSEVRLSSHIDCMRSDHSVVTVKIGLGSASRKPSARHTSFAIKGPDHALAIQLSLAMSPPSHVLEFPDAGEAWHALVNEVHHKIATAPLLNVPPKSSWLQEHTWSLIKVVKHARKTLRLWGAQLPM